MVQIKEKLRLYLEHGIEPGGFLMAVLSNDLVGAFSKADNENLQILDEIVKYVYNNLPSNSWGSREIVSTWLKKY